MNVERSGGRAVFLSYASQDVAAAKHITDALRAAGVEVWFDADGGLEHGDEWDAKIRRQIKECVLFIPLISANTQAREEGYFRIEWELAAQRALGIASGVAFILPVVIDNTKEPDALVPDRFRTVQWTKLPGGVVPPEVLQRFLKLWSHRTSALKHAVQAAQGGSVAAEQPPASAPRVRWLPRVIGGVVLALIALLVARPWPRSGSPSPATAAPASGAQTPDPKISEASALVAKAWALMNKADLARAELELADGYCRQATELDPNDASAWAAWSQVDTWTTYHNFDRSPVRREGARTKAARAAQLAPTAYEPRLARACQLVRGSGDDTISAYAPGAEQLLASLLQERPEEPRALLALGILQRNLGKVPEFRATFVRLTKNPAWAALAWNELGWAEYLNGDPTAAGEAGERSIALQPYWGNLLLKELLAQRWRGDLDEAQAAADRLPLASRQEDNGICLVAELNYWRRDPEAMLRVLDPVPREWLQSNGFEGPKAYWAALAQRLAGHEAAEQLQWRAALAAVERRLAQQPDSALLIRWKGLVLAESGDRAAAAPLIRLAREMGYTVRNAGVHALEELLLGNLDGAIDRLELAEKEGGAGVSAATYRLNPDFDPLRSQPRFQALLARMEADPRFSPRAPAPATVAPLSEARQLAARARQFCEFGALTRERLGAAEDLLERALKLDPTEADVWAVGTQVDVFMIFRGWDNSDVRRQAAGQKVARALALAPDGFESRHAQAVLAAFLVRTKESFAEAEGIYQALVQERPDNRDLWVEWGALRVAMRRFDEAVALFRRADRPLLAGQALYLDGRFAEARRIADAALAEKRTAEALVLKSNVELFGYNDRAAAQAAISRLTPTELREDEAAAAALRLALLSRDAPAILKLLEPYPRPFVSIGVDYPRQYWTGVARMIQQQPEAALIEWRGALQSVEERLKAKPNDSQALSWVCFMQARVGDRAAAERSLRLYQNYVDLSRGYWDWNYCLTLLCLGGHDDEVIDRLDKTLRHPNGRSLHINYAWARFSPEFDPVRGNPRFEKLLRDTRPKDALPLPDQGTGDGGRQAVNSAEAKP